MGSIIDLDSLIVGSWLSSGYGLFFDLGGSG